jgi:hypothetical protein
MSLESPDNILNVRNAVLKVSRVEMNTLSANTVSSNLTVAGDATMSSNLEVGTANLYVDTTTGRVGVGTNTPMAVLDVKGVLNHTQVANVAQITSNSNVVMEYRRSKKLIKYPRVAMTSASSGGYTASASSEASATYPAFKAFDNSINFHTDSWEQSGSSFTASTGNLTSPGTEPTTNGIAGPWIQIELPHTILLSSWSFRSLKHPSLTNVGRDRSPYDGYLFGSTDGSTWSIIENWTDRTTWEDGKALTFNVSTNTYYKYFRLVWTRTRPGGSYSHLATVTELQFFGLPEYDPEAHGTDVVLHTTPNVPNTDFSNVYYDGQDYTSMPATVADKSGNGVTGTPSGGVGFDTTYKAFTFDGVDDKITATLTNPAGAWVHSASMWFKVNSLSAVNTLFTIKNDTTAENNQTPNFIVFTDGRLRYTFWDNDIYYGGPGTIVPKKWYHVSVTYSGGSDTSSRRVFLNGVELGISSTSGSSQNTALNVYANSTLKIGVYADGTTNPFNGSIANFRLYNNALSADEIWELYAYQKEYFGVSPDMVTLKAGRVGIGTSEPRAVLDVRGDIHATGSLNPVAGMWKQTINNTTVSTTIIKNIGSCMTTKAAVGHGANSGISGTAGAFVAPYDGVYQFQFFVLGENTSSNLLLLFKASGPTVSNGTWNNKNMLPTYQEVVDLRGVANEEEPHGLSTLLNMSKEDTIEVDVHSAGLIGNGASTGGGYVRCSCFLVHRELN